jgi:hypothetical protein
LRKLQRGSRQGDFQACNILSIADECIRKTVCPLIHRTDDRYAERLMAKATFVLKARQHAWFENANGHAAS